MQTGMRLALMSAKSCDPIFPPVLSSHSLFIPDGILPDPAAAGA